MSSVQSPFWYILRSSTCSGGKWPPKTNIEPESISLEFRIFLLKTQHFRNFQLLVFGMFNKPFNSDGQPMAIPWYHAPLASKRWKSCWATTWQPAFHPPESPPRKAKSPWPNVLAKWFRIFHQDFPEIKGIPAAKPPFGVSSCEVAIIWPECYKKATLL